MIQKVVPQATGESSKVKVKVRMNIHGIFSVSSASLVEVLKGEESEELMDTEQTTTPTTEKEEEVMEYFTLCLSLPSALRCTSHLKINKIIL